MATNKHKIGETNNITKKSLYTKGFNNVKDYVLPEVCHTNNGIPIRSIAKDINLRPGNNRHDYYNQRTNDKLPTDHADIIRSCQAVYRKVGMVRNIIDLMTDFASEGLELEHSIKTQERFFKEWARRVDLNGRVHDFMKLMMRDANVIVRRKNALITRPVIKEMTRAIQHERLEKIKPTKTQNKKHEIPWKYTFLSPVIVEKIGGEVGRFFGSDSLGIRIHRTLANAIQNPATPTEKKLVSQLPSEVLASARKTGSLIPLDMDKIYVDYYKKDDWEDWGTPFLYGVLEDILFKEKMRLADIAALDGVINVVRLWKLGNSDQQIMPTSAAVDKLINILQHNTGGGVMDLVWDDMIDLHVEYPPTDKILGPDKYISVNIDIVRGIGIPDSLIGGSVAGTGNASSVFAQLKTLAERLEYVRGRAIRWMEGELRLVADAMGFKHIPNINFGIMSLRDEAAEKQLIVQLLDRGIISAQKAAETFGTNYMIELERLKEEQKVRETHPGILEKSDPYHRPFSVMDKQNELAIKLEKVKQDIGGSGVDKGGGDNPSGDQPKNESVNTPGRPSIVKDTTPRDKRTPTSQSVLHIIAHTLLDDVDQLFDAEYIRQHKVKNMRSLTKAQRHELEITKRGILSVLRPGDTVTKKLVAARIDGAEKVAEQMAVIFDDFMTEFSQSNQKMPTANERRILTVLAWEKIIERMGL